MAKPLTLQDVANFKRPSDVGEGEVSYLLEDISRAIKARFNGSGVQKTTGSTPSVMKQPSRV